MTQSTWDRSNPYTLDVTAGGEHVDGYGHVSTPCYVQWMIDCAFAHSSAVGLPESVCREMARGMAAVHFEIDLLGAAYAGDRLRVATWITGSDGKLRLRRHLQIINVDSGRTLARADFDFVCTNLDTGKPARMPPEFRERYVINSEAMETE